MSAHLTGFAVIGLPRIRAPRVVLFSLVLLCACTPASPRFPSRPSDIQGTITRVKPFGDFAFLIEEDPSISIDMGITTKQRDKAYIYVDSTSVLVLRRLPDGRLGRGTVADFREGIQAEVRTTGNDAQSYPVRVDAIAVLLFDSTSLP